MKAKIQASLAAFALCAALPVSAFANTTVSNTINVSATVNTDCTLQTPASIAFGNVNVDPVTLLTASNPQSGTATIKCNSGTPYTIGVGPVGGSASFAQTTLPMLSGTTNSLNYTVALASYGATAPSSASVTDAITLAIPAGQDAFVGSYTGSFAVSIIF
jgi:spore coat protein U-like protein